MKTHLIIPFYKDKNEDRQKELETVIKRNLIGGYDWISFFIEEKDTNYAVPFISKHQSPVGGYSHVFTNIREPFQTYIDYANSFHESNTLFIVCNSDIYITPEELIKFINLDWKKSKLALFLSRWDEYDDGGLVHLNRPDSADTMIFKGNCDVINADYPLGFPGIENSLCYKFREKGYNVVNPSKDIVTRHLHNVHVYNYREGSKPDGPVKAEQICPEPYGFHLPIFSNEI